MPDDLTCMKLEVKGITNNDILVLTAQDGVNRLSKVRKGRQNVYKMMSLYELEQKDTNNKKLIYLVTAIKKTHLAI